MVADPLAIQVMKEFKRALLAYEEAQVARMVKAWMTVDRALAADIRALAEEIARLRSAGEVVTEARLYRLSRYQALVAQIQAEITRYERTAAQIIMAGEEDLARMGARHAQGAIRAMYQTFGVRGAFNRLPVRAVEYLVGLTADGGPLFGVLQERALTPAAVQGLVDTLIEAVTRGWNPRKTARAMQDGMTGGLQKALVIARDQQLRVYRMASDQQYRESGVVTGKRRVAAKDGRTCLACLAMDGELIPVGMEMYDHTQGRCTAIPVVEGLPPLSWQYGQQWFESLPAAKQREMMGPGRYEMWRDGAFDFRDLATPTYDPVWGRGLAVTPLSQLGASQQGQIPLAAAGAS